ncbi:hypothetical protein ACXR2U_21285 [Jatrophihabitans sp. YIM 134969]
MKLFTGLATLAVAVAACLVPTTSAAAAAAPTLTVTAPATVTVGVKAKIVATVTPTTATGTVRFTPAGGSVAPGCGAVPVASGKAVCKILFSSTTPVKVTARFTKSNGTAVSGSVVVSPVDGAAGQLVGGVGACTRRTGALVAVSYGAWGGPIVRGCDTTLTTGIDLLTTAGFTTTGTQHDGPAFLCRIGHPYWKSGTQYPTPATEACVNTPPADAYWSYWIAPKGQTTWSYSPLGAYSSNPTPGSVEAWTFGSTDVGGTTGQPLFTPNQIRDGLPTT